MYASIYGAQTWMQQATQAAYQESKVLNEIKRALGNIDISKTYSVKKVGDNRFQLNYVTAEADEIGSQGFGLVNHLAYIDGDSRFVNYGQWRKGFNAGVGYVPVAGGLYDMYQGALDGNGWKIGIGAAFVVLDVVTGGEGTAGKGALSSLNPTHIITNSKSVMKDLVTQIKNVGINETIKYVEHNGANYIVDGNHRFFAASKLGIGEVPIQKVQLPYLGYQTPADLILTGKQPMWWNFFKP